jgi:hypothetical protein
MAGVNYASGLLFFRCIEDPDIDKIFGRAAAAA